MASRSPWGIWVAAHSLRPPGTSGSGSAAKAFGSIGIAAMRWLTKRPLTTTAASAKKSSPAGPVTPRAMLDVLPGKMLRGVGGDGRDRVDDDGQRVVVDHDRLRRVDGLGVGGGDHQGDRLADEADPIGGERRPGDHRVARHESGDGADVEVGGREDGHDARHGGGFGDVDRRDEGMSHRGPHEDA